MLAPPGGLVPLPRGSPGSATAQIQITSQLQPRADTGFSPGGEKVQG